MGLKYLQALAAHQESRGENPDAAKRHRKKQGTVGVRIGDENEGGDADSEQESGAAHTARLGAGSAGDVSDSVRVRRVGVHGGNVPLSQSRSDGALVFVCAPTVSEVLPRTSGATALKLNPGAETAIAELDYNL
jgi:hypothetical protein